MVMRPGDGDPRHGTANGYGNLKCRCEACRAAWAERCRGRRAIRAARLAGTVTTSHVLAVEPTHGSYSTYWNWNWNCRCDDCKAAAAAHAREKDGRDTRNTTQVQAWIDEAVNRTVKTELSRALEEAKAEVKAAVRAQGAEVIADTIARMAKVPA